MVAERRVETSVMAGATDAGRVRVFREDDTFAPMGGSSVTVGRFDGMHRGHRALLQATCQVASDQRDGRAIAVTLWPPPEWILRPAEPRQMLTTLDDRIALLASSGVDDIVVMRFDQQFSRRSAEDFLGDLMQRLNLRTLVTGPTAAIGRDREGTPDVIARLAPRLGFTHVPVRYEGAPGAISSTQARNALSSGEVDRLRAILGRSHSMYGVVCRGEGLGRGLGFPTANVELPEWLVLPADGVYAGSALVDGDPEPYSALISVGTRPTFSSRTRLFEVHLLGFNRDIYGLGLRTFIHAWLRVQEAFDSVEALVAAMRRDREAAEAVDLAGKCEVAPFVPGPN